MCGSLYAATTTSFLSLQMYAIRHTVLVNSMQPEDSSQWKNNYRFPYTSLEKSAVLEQDCPKLADLTTGISKLQTDRWLHWSLSPETN